MGSLTHVCVWSSKGWTHIAPEEVARSHPGESVSARSGLFMCELCGQYAKSYAVQKILNLKILQCLHNRILFFLRTLGLLGVFTFRFMVILSLDDAVLLLHLCDIEIGNL